MKNFRGVESTARPVPDPPHARPLSVVYTAAASDTYTHIRQPRGAAAAPLRHGRTRSAAILNEFGLCTEADIAETMAELRRRRANVSNDVGKTRSGEALRRNGCRAVAIRFLPSPSASAVLSGRRSLNVCVGELIYCGGKGGSHE